MAKAAGEDELFIIGGGEIYRQSMELVDRMYITEVDIETEGDTFFPEIDESQWKLSSEEYHKADERNKWNYCFKIYDRSSR